MLSIAVDISKTEVFFIRGKKMDGGSHRRYFLARYS